MYLVMVERGAGTHEKNLVGTVPLVLSRTPESCGTKTATGYGKLQRDVLFDG